jgi:tRNA G18 (ribose-2'-O)-methylase SpoU
MPKKYSSELLLNTKKIADFKSIKRNPIILILDNIRSVYNVGAIFRTADACLVEKIYLCGITAYPPRKDLNKTALGAEEYVPWEYIDDTLKAVELAKASGAKIIGLEQTDGSLDYRRADYSGKIALIIGNEVDGIEDGVLELCDQSIEIPMYGLKNSLNVTTALGVVLYKAIE